MCLCTRSACPLSPLGTCSPPSAGPAKNSDNCVGDKQDNDGELDDKDGDSNLGDIFKDDNDKYGDQNDVKRKSWAICNNFSKPSTRQPL